SEIHREERAGDRARTGIRRSLLLLARVQEDCRGVAGKVPQQITHRPRSSRKVSAMGMLETTGTASSAATRKENTLRKLDRLKKVAIRGAGPRADQRFLLGRLHPSMADGTRPAGGRQSVLPLRPRLDR